MRTMAGALQYAKANFRAPVEKFSAVWVDKDGSIIGTTELASGHLDVVGFNPASMVNAGKVAGASHGFLIHNDPSNDVETDEGSDYRDLTQRVSDALANVQIVFVDHLIVTPKQTVSLRAVIEAERDDSDDGDPLSELMRELSRQDSDD